MLIRSLLVMWITLCSAISFAEEPSMGPVIDDYGPTFPIENRDVFPPDDYNYRVVFDAADYGGGTSALNAELVSVARFLNMHARNGVSLENMDVAVVLHGEALKSALADKAYMSRYQSSNPNHDLLMKLHSAGVAFYACGQSMGFRDFAKDELASPVQVALSAMTMLTTLQAEGYALLP